MDLVEYFEQRVKDTEEQIRYCRTEPGFKILQVTTTGERDITAEHIESLERARDDYQQAIDHIKARASEH